MGRTYHETESYGKTNKTVSYFIAETTQSEVVMGINPIMGKAEHEEYQWLTFDEARALSVGRITKVLNWAEDRIKNVYAVRSDFKKTQAG